MHTISILLSIFPRRVSTSRSSSRSAGPDTGSPNREIPRTASRACCLRSTILRSRRGSCPGTGSCPLTSRRLSLQIESGSTCSLLPSPTRPSHSRSPPGRWTSRRRGSGPTGTGRPRSSSSSSVSSCWTRGEEGQVRPRPPPLCRHDLQLLQPICRRLLNLHHQVRGFLHLQHSTLSRLHRGCNLVTSRVVLLSISRQHLVGLNFTFPSSVSDKYII